MIINFSKKLYCFKAIKSAIKEYKNALKIDPNSSKTLYSLAFSFSKKGSYLGIALRSKNNSKRTLSEF